MDKNRIKMDWEKETSNGTRTYEIYPTGSYEVEITGWQECESKHGTPQIRWFTEIKIPDTYGGKSLVDHTPLTEASLWRLANLVKACGIDVSKAPAMAVGSDAFKKMLDMCVHRRTIWRIRKDEQYNNNKVEEYLQCEGALVDPRVDLTNEEQCPF